MKMQTRWAVMLSALLALGGQAVDAAKPAKRNAVPKKSTTEFSMSLPSPLAFAYVVISVADMDRALGLWAERFGMQVVTRREGTDPDLARAWGLGADGIADQALLRTPGMTDGGVHLVRFKTPGATVREGAAPTDQVLKSVDISVRDIAARYAELTAAGYKFRSTPSKLQGGDLEFFEVHMFGPDDVNLVFVDIPSKPEPVSEKFYGVAPQIVVTNPDNVRETTFFQSALGLELISHNTFAGPEIEKAVGLPKGAKLDIRILGNPQSHYGRLEFVQYEGASGRNLYPRTQPPARGMLSITYVLKDLSPLLARASALGLTDHGVTSSVLGRGRLVTLATPAGLRLNLLQPQGP